MQNIALAHGFAYLHPLPRDGTLPAQIGLNEEHTLSDPVQIVPLASAHNPERLLPPEELVFGRSEAMARVRHMLRMVAGTSLPALIYGESGTGKEVIARMLHLQSPWRSGPFVQVNCPALPASLVESEMFGYEQGAFTGAGATKRGRVETAEGGTLFLDEIGDFALGLQSKLLQLLQDGNFARIGAHGEQHSSARFICASNRNLAREVELGQFRRDLFYRINAVTIELPPLRERREDIPALADYFLQQYALRFERPRHTLSATALDAMRSYIWPGNIRQLQNVIKRMVILGTEDVIGHELASRGDEELGFYLDREMDRSLKEITQTVVEKLEKAVISRSLRANNWNRRRVSRSLKISYRALLYKIKKLELPAKTEPEPVEEAD